ncbi:MAG: NUDIX domain-containing protein [Dehalococcoidia bacterium]
MAKTRSGGLLMYRIRDGELQVLLGHPGGPFWTKKDLGAWSIPKGEIDEGEEPLQTAIREFEEETGFRVDGMFLPLSEVRQSGGKTVHAWAVEGDIDPATLTSNTFSLEWPPKSGNVAEFPELDRVEWFSIEEAGRRVLKGQLPLLEELRTLIRV